MSFKQMFVNLKALKQVTDWFAVHPQAVDARQEIDLRLGAAFTRFQTTLLQHRFNTQNEVCAR